jgi:hypothetical protein
MPGIVKLLSAHKAFFFRKMKIFLIIETQPPEPLFFIRVAFCLPFCAAYSEP